MFKKVMSCILAFAVAFTCLSVFRLDMFKAVAVATAEPYHYFYDQLSPEAQNVYNVLYEMYEDGSLKGGTKTVDLVEKGAISSETLEAYLAGDPTLSDIFSAAKDAFDLECPDAWYFDSSYISMRVGKKESGEYAVYMGIGRADTYLLPGLNAGDVEKMDAQVSAAIAEIVTAAQNLDVTGLSTADADARRVKLVHDTVTKSISYKFKTECKPENAPYIRTIYSLVTHEGVCEGYARTMQAVLNRLGIPCVLVHGIQNSGNSPEMHMWNEVRIGEKWYALDATWDDPIRLDKDGNRINGDGKGNDGGEVDSYLLVGSEVVGNNWLPSGVVSSGNMSFTYPEIEQSAYNGDDVYNDSVTGLHVSYTANGEMEGETAGQFTVDYNGMGMGKAAEQGVYLLIKMYDQHPDGTSHSMADWYYVAAALVLSENNEFFYDTDKYLKLYTATCEYVEFALTTRRPKGFETWGNRPESNGLSKDPETGFYQGDGSDIIAQTELLYNAAAAFEAAPCIYRQSPAPTGQLDTRQMFNIHIEFDDRMYHPVLSEISTVGITNQGAPETEDYRRAANEPIQVKFATYQQDRDGEIFEMKLVSKTSADLDGDYIIDDGVVTWLYDCDKNHVHDPENCFVKGLEYNFRASTNWSDDLTLYDFQITGLVGSRSNKAPNSWSYIMSTSVCPMAYRSQGIDWALWGRPYLLDNPDDLDLSKLAAEGTDGSKTSLEELQKKMKIDDMNGRLMLTVEEIGKEDGMSRAKYNEVTEAFDEHTNIPESAIKSSKMYEINFTRLCKMTVVLEGESLRMQLGFPEGYDAEDVANKEVVFKAYHFTRCSETKHCQNENKPGHKYGDDIISVEEIPLAVTQYGLVILCDSFSPFEIVALDASQIIADEIDHNIIVKTDGNGSVTCDGVPAVGADGFISFEEGESHTFKVEAKDGYTVDVVSFGGRNIAVGADGSFKLTYYDIIGANDMLNVSFVPKTVKAQEQEAGVVTVVPKVVSADPVIVVVPNQDIYTITRGKDSDTFCGAPTVNVLGADTITVSGHGDTKNYTAGTSFTLEAPSKAGEYYNYTITAVKGDSTVTREIKVGYGHGVLSGRSTFVFEDSCTNNKYEVTMYKCRDCGRFYVPFASYDKAIKKTEHSHDLSKSETINSACDGLTYTIKKCTKCSYIEVETSGTPNADAQHNWMPFVKESACDTDGISYEVCTECGAIRSVLALPSHAHFVGSSFETSPSGDCTKDKVKMSVCADCKEKFSSPMEPNKQHLGSWKTVKEPNCKESGLKEWVCSVCGFKETEELPADKSLHSYKEEITKKPTCTDKGTITHTCEYCGDTYTTEVKALGGEHNYVPIRTVSATCATDGVETYQCTVCGDSYEEITPATGEHVYKDDHNCETEERCKVCRKIMNPAKPHEFGDYYQQAWDKNNHYRKCKNCDFVQTETHFGTDDGDCTTAVKCSACGKEIKSAKTHHSPFNSELLAPVPGHEAELHSRLCVEDGCKYQYTSGNYVSSHTFVNDVCTGCGYSRANHDHEAVYVADETGHHLECAVCKIVLSEVQPHDKSAEDGYEGDCHKAVTCSECGYTVLPALLEHSWCEDWHTNSEYHYHNCTIKGCDAQLRFEHNGTSDRDCTTPTLCDDCGYEIVAAGTEHSWAVKPGSGNENTHLLECTNPDCDAEKHEAHVQGTAATCCSEAECDLCHTHYGELDPKNHVGGTELRNEKEATYESEGYTGDLYCLGCEQVLSAGKVIPVLDEVHEHDFSVEGHNDKEHWLSCSGCGEIDSSSIKEHSFDYYHNDGDTHYRQCLDCGYRQVGVHEHTPEDYNCETAITCIYCDAVIVPAQSHNFAGRVEGDESGHWVACVNVNCRHTSEKTAHIGGTASCTSGAHCELCGIEYTEKDPKNHVGETRLDGYKPATAEAEGYTGDTYCETCGELISKGETIERLSAEHSHSYNGWLHNAQHHYHECSCGHVEDLGEHTFGDYVADGENHYRECTVCGYREITKHTPKDEDYNCETEVLCKDCNAVIEKALKHNFAGNVTSDETGHQIACTNPNCHVLSDKSAHTGGTATCESGKHCEVCGFEYTEKDSTNHSGGTHIVGHKPATAEEEGYTGDTYCLGCGEKLADGEVIERLPADHVHEFGEWKYDSEHHYRECLCGEIEEYGDHIFKDGVCTLCGAKQNKPEKEPEKEPDVPPTGGPNSIILGIMLVSISAFAVCAVKSKKKSR